MVWRKRKHVAICPGRCFSHNVTKCLWADGVNSICFNQADLAFTPGVLAFTRVMTADRIGVQFGSGAPSSEVGEILDADIYFNPSDSGTSYATPLALTGTPSAYDMESILTHEMGHALGFSHSAVWSAMMFPFAPTVGTFSGTRPSQAQPDAPLGEDDRTGLRILYPDPSDTLRVGAVRGHILNANPLSLPASPPGVTGVFGSHVVAVDTASGAVVGATIGGWSCSDPGPAQFDGSYAIERLPTGSSYQVYAEPLNGAVDPSQISNATASVCRNSTSDPGWPHCKDVWCHLSISALPFERGPDHSGLQETTLREVRFMSVENQETKSFLLWRLLSRKLLATGCFKFANQHTGDSGRAAWFATYIVARRIVF